MNQNILYALLIGITAGVLDIIPMLKNPMVKNKIYKFSIASVFAQWVLLGLLIPFVRWDLEPWIKGFIIGVLGMAPTAILTFGRLENKAISARILIHGGILGAAVGVIAAFVGI